MRDHDASPSRERWVGGSDEMEEDGLEKTRESSKHRSKDKGKSGGHRSDRDNKSKDREREKTHHASKDRDKLSKDIEKHHPSRDRKKADNDELEREKNRDRVQERDTDRDHHKDRERDRKDRSKEKEQERERERDRNFEGDVERGGDKDRRKDKTREKEREKDRERDRERERERESERGKMKDRGNDYDRSRDVVEKEKIKERHKEKESDRENERPRDKDIRSHKQQDESRERGRDLKLNDRSRTESDVDQDVTKQVKGSYAEDESEAFQNQHKGDDGHARLDGSAKELEDRIIKMKEERLKRKSEGVSEVLAWVSRSRKLEERKKNAEKEKVLHLSRKFEEQDNMIEEENDDDDNVTRNINHNLSGVRVLHGIDKVLEGGAVVLTLKDQSILADGGVNEDIDVLENIEIGEQKRRDEAYKAAKKTGVYDDKFNEDPGSEKKMLPQYDDPVADEGITLDAGGRFTDEAEKKLEALRRRIEGVSVNKNFEDLNSTGRLSSDYYTQEEMLQFKKPKKKKSLRKKEKLDIDALEAEAKSAGLGVGDLGSRNDSKSQALREQQERNEAEIRSRAYQSALAKADEASKTLRLGQIPLSETEEVDAPAIGDDDEELQKSLARARRIALTKQEQAVKPGPHALALLASSTTSESAAENQNSLGTESQEKKLVFTEIEGFFLALQQDEVRNPDVKDVFMDEDVVPSAPAPETKEEEIVWSEVKESMEEEPPEIKEEEEEEIVADETIHEVPFGKGIAGALKHLKERGDLKESVEWGGRNMDKKKSKLAGIYDDGPREIRIERTDEYGRILTPKESFRLLSHKFHGKGPGKMKQEKRMRQYMEELKVKQMANSDTPTHSVERMREVQIQQKSPYLVLSGHVKPGQTSDPRSGFATVEKDFPGGLTPMLGDKKVEYFLGKRKSEHDDAGSQKKSKA